MSNVNYQNDLFLGRQELGRRDKFLREDGYLRIFQSLISSYGLVNTSIDANNFLVETGSNVGTIKISSDSYGLDTNMDIIYQEAIDNIGVTDDSAYYWVKVSYESTHIEKGVINLAVNGDATGIGTEFTKVLREQNSYPVKVHFPNSVSNTGDYQVVSVLSDTQAVLSGTSGFVGENNIEYAVVGSFTPGINLTGDDRFPYIYDSCNIEFIPEVTLDVPPAKLAGTEFYIARVTRTGGVVTITDKRTEFLAI